MAKKRKASPTERAYSAQVKRIKSFIRRAEKRGYRFSDNMLPEKPKRVTQASVRRLQRLTPEKMYQKAVYGGELSYGEIVPAKIGLKLERKARAEKAKQTRKRKRETVESYNQIPSTYVPEISTPYVLDDESFYDRTVIENFKQKMSSFKSFEAYEKVMEWLYHAIDQSDEHDVANALNKAAEDGYMIDYKVMYNETLLFDSLTRMTSYLDMSQGVKNDLMDSIENSEEYKKY